jgi:hypothetical protein
LPGQSGAEKKLLARTRNQVVKTFGESDDLRMDVEISLADISRPLPPPPHLEPQRIQFASLFRHEAECLREFVAARQKKAKELRRLRKLQQRPGDKAPTGGDGPVLPDGFRHNGKVYDDPPLGRGPFRALCFAWKSKGRCVESSDLPEALYGDREAGLEDAESTLRGFRGQLNAFFGAHHLPYHATVRGYSIAIKDGASRAAKSAKRSRSGRKKKTGR